MRGLTHRAKFDPEIIAKRRRVELSLREREYCTKCERELDETKYHDCGEQAELFDTTSYRHPKPRRSRKAVP